MGWRSIADLQNIALKFELGAGFDSAERFGSGHINDTFIVNTSLGTEQVRFVLQRINSSVFRDPAAVMENVGRVTEYLHAKSPGKHSSLTLVPTVGGAHFHVDESGEFWRMYRYLEGTRSYDSVPSVAHAREAAAEFGRFQAMLRDLPGPRLHETIDRFHDTPSRYAQLRESLASDAHDRAKDCAPEIDWALAREAHAGLLIDLQRAGEIPERITHNDTKINNVMFDIETDKAVCVIDLDTVMPGIALHDFGDMVRSATTSAAEDEHDLSQVTMRMDSFEALVDGFLGTAGDLLNEVEVENLALAGKIITIEAGVRFLADFLAGDEYFRVQRPHHNLDRCRAQFALAASIEEQLDNMQRLVAERYRRGR